jgi:hypothetical protein
MSTEDLESRDEQNQSTTNSTMKQCHHMKDPKRLQRLNHEESHFNPQSQATAITVHFGQESTKLGHHLDDGTY